MSFSDRSLRRKWSQQELRRVAIRKAAPLKRETKCCPKVASSKVVGISEGVVSSVVRFKIPQVACKVKAGWSLRGEG